MPFNDDIYYIAEFRFIVRLKKQDTQSYALVKQYEEDGAYFSILYTKQN
jgi:hypothetical protein